MDRHRIRFAVAAILLLITEIGIALFVHDRFVRPYLGDVLVVILLYCLIRTLRPQGLRLLPLYLFLFAGVVEVAQYLQVLTWLGLAHIRLLQVLVGTRFSWWDMLCYLAGCGVCALLDRHIQKKHT